MRRIKTDIKVSSYAAPLITQKESTAYGERMQFVTAFNELPPTGYDLNKYLIEQIKIWRRMATNPYIDFAIDDIVNEMLSEDNEKVYPIDIDLSGTNFSENIRNKIHDEFITAMKLLSFSKNAYSQIRDWLVDSRAIYYVEFSKNGKDIVSVTQLDPTRIQKITNENDETIWQYHDPAKSNNTMDAIYTIPDEHIIEINSGVMDERHMIWVSYLHKAYIPLNQVNSIEDALVIYRLARAPERRVFYVDVGELPKSKAEQYMREIINNYRNKMEYDSSTGTIKEKVRHMSLLDDVWLPRAGGSRGTEVSTLPGGQNLGETEDLTYFLKKLFRSLNIPFSRWGGDETTMNVIGRTSEINRDEVKYNKFISRLRQQYNTLFFVLLRTLLNIKNIVSSEEFNKEKENVIFKWNADNMFNTFRQFDILKERSELMDMFETKIGKVVSIDWVRKNIMGQTDEEITEMKKQINSEKSEMKSLGFIEDDNSDDNFGNNSDDEEEQNQEDTKEVEENE